MGVHVRGSRFSRGLPTAPAVASAPAALAAAVQFAVQVDPILDVRLCPFLAPIAALPVVDRAIVVAVVDCWCPSRTSRWMMKVTSD